MFEYAEFEEQIGRLWHRVASEAGGQRAFPEAAVPLDEVRRSLAVFFRALGGDPGLTVTAAAPEVSGHRLAWHRRLGRTAERLEVARRDGQSVFLPARLDTFPHPVLNGDLYLWLAAFLSDDTDGETHAPDDPLQADLAFLRRAAVVSDRLCARYPGLAVGYARLCEWTRALRPPRRLRAQEAAVEGVVRRLLGETEPEPDAEADRMSAFVCEGRGNLDQFTAARGYRTFMPVPLWGRLESRSALRAERDDEAPEVGGRAEDEEPEAPRKLRAHRERHDQAERDDPLILNRFEKVLSWAEMVNVNRPTEDEDLESARRAADDQDHVTISATNRRAATRLRLDLDLAPQDAAITRLQGPVTYPEWDHRRGCYHPDHCRVIEAAAITDATCWQPDQATRRRIRLVRRQFEALRPRSELLRQQWDGPELDVDAAVRSQIDVLATGLGSNRIYQAYRQQARDLAVSVLVDVSLSTDAWVANRRVLDIEKEALMVLAHALASCADPFEIRTFTSRRRDYIRIEAVKKFEEPLSDTVLERIAGLRPGYYTRIGAALRHTANNLEARGERHRLILVLTDGKPNDLDHYEGRYGIEDTRMAIKEARRMGLAVFGITIDRKAQDYFPYLFGRGGYAIVRNTGNLPLAIPAIYRQLIM